MGCGAINDMKYRLIWTSRDLEANKKRKWPKLTIIFYRLSQTHK